MSQSYNNYKIYSNANNIVQNDFNSYTPFYNQEIERRIIQQRDHNSFVQNNNPNYNFYGKNYYNQNNNKYQDKSSYLNHLNKYPNKDEISRSVSPMINDQNFSINK